LKCGRVDGATLVFDGEVDMSTMDTITASVDAAPHVGDVACDLSGVSYMDSSGLRALLDARQHLADEGRRLTVAARGRSSGCSRSPAFATCF
jgi:anti-anti-sigma factor